MTTEQSFFLSALSDHLHRNPTNIPSALDWNEITSIAKSHQVEGILYYQCKQQCFLQGYSSTLFYYTNRAKTIAALTERLNEVDIEHFIIKGASVAAFYPVPALRTMGDTDLVVHREDRERTNEIMLGLGFKNQSSFDDREWVYYKGDMEFELHDHLVYTEDVNQDKHVTFFNDFWKYVHDGELDPNFHFLFLLLHLRKHLMNSGVGFRQFMDIAVMMQQDLNWGWIIERLSELELLEFCQTVVALIEKWFGVPAPVPNLTKEIGEYFCETAAEAVFKNGVFGFDNAENSDNVVINARIAGKSSTSLVAHKLFPSYRSMCIVPYYSFLKGKPWLLPAAWLYRIVRTVVQGKTKNRMKFLADSFVDKEKIERRNEELKQWGLK